MIDAKGLSCPEPLVLLKKAMEDKKDKYEIVVDAKVAMENISKFAKARSYDIDVKEEGSSYFIKLSKK